MTNEKNHTRRRSNSNRIKVFFRANRCRRRSAGSDSTQSHGGSFLGCMRLLSQGRNNQWQKAGQPIGRVPRGIGQEKMEFGQDE